MDRVSDHGGAGGLGEASFQYLISSKGAEKAREALDRSQYAGPAPVPIADYNAMAARQADVGIAVNRARLHEVFSHLVLNQRVLDHLGPALSARHACFLYGPSGNGKTSIAERITASFGQEIWIPRAIGIDGEIIRLYEIVP